MLKFLDSIPWAFIIIACLSIGLAPYNPPHFVEKLQTCALDVFKSYALPIYIIDP